MELAHTFLGSVWSVAQSYGLLNGPFCGIAKGFKGFPWPEALEKAFVKTLTGHMQSLSIHPDLATLPEGRAQEYSSVAQDWAPFLRFLAGFMCILGLLWAFLTALRGLPSLKRAFLGIPQLCFTGLKLSAWAAQSF